MYVILMSVSLFFLYLKEKFWSMVERGRGNTATSKGIYLNLKKFEGKILVDGEGGRGNTATSPPR